MVCQTKQRRRWMSSNVGRYFGQPQDREHARARCHYLALHLGYVGSSLPVTNPKLSMIIDNTERSNRGGAGGIIEDFLSTGKELDGNTKINLKKPKLASRRGPRRKPSVRPGNHSSGEAPGRDD